LARKARIWRRDRITKRLTRRSILYRVFHPSATSHSLRGIREKLIVQYLADG
jgi:hypothetical protein